MMQPTTPQPEPMTCPITGWFIKMRKPDQGQPRNRSGKFGKMNAANRPKP